MTKEKTAKMKVDEFEECYFCNLRIIPLDFSYRWNPETIEKLKDLFGTVPGRQVGKIGDKIICDSCIRDLEGLLNFEPRKDEYNSCI